MHAMNVMAKGPAPGSQLIELPCVSVPVGRVVCMSR